VLFVVKISFPSCETWSQVENKNYIGPGFGGKIANYCSCMVTIYNAKNYLTKIHLAHPLIIAHV